MNGGVEVELDVVLGILKIGVLMPFMTLLMRNLNSEVTTRYQPRNWKQKIVLLIMVRSYLFQEGMSLYKLGIKVEFL